MTIGCVHRGSRQYLEVADIESRAHPLRANEYVELPRSKGHTRNRDLKFPRYHLFDIAAIGPREHVRCRSQALNIHDVAQEPLEGETQWNTLT